MDMDDEMDYFNAKRRRESIDEDEERRLNEYFASYVPLSNLPTPPLSSSSSPMMNSKMSTIDSNLLAPSLFLSKLVPQNAAVNRPTADQIATYLTRASLPESTIAFAACILDSLSSTFVRSWRRTCEKLRLPERTSFLANPMKPELIVLAVLAIAHGFLSDSKSETSFWANRVANRAVEPREIDGTMRCLLKDIDYQLLSFTPEEVEAMRQDMYESVSSGVRGKAVFRQGQYTPELTPF